MTFSSQTANVDRVFLYTRKTPLLLKTILTHIMRLGIITAAICITTSIQLLFASPTKSQPINEVKINLALHNETLVDAFKKIEHDTKYHFMYRIDEVKKIRNLNFTSANVSIEAFLKWALKETPLVYRQVGDQILIMDAKNQVSLTTNNESKTHYYAMDNVVKGMVTDEKGQPLSEVSVTVKGSAMGTTTNKDGHYSINVAENGVLVFSIVGYMSQEIAVNNLTTINVALVKETKELNEVVVTALGIKKSKRGLVYSAAEVKGSEFTEARETNVASALTGKIAGVDATQIASGPGGSSRIVIRGVGAINPSANNQPLYVVNGSPIYNGNGGAAASSTGFNYDTGDGISSINPDDIESITVLKSGAAAALYGSQAANGVILITTKSGRVQKGIGVDFNSNLVYGTPSSYPNYQYEYGSGNDGVKPATQAAALSAGRLSYGAKMDGSKVVQFDGVERPYSPVKVKDNVNNFYRPSRNFTNTIAFYGGTNAVNFRLSASDLGAQAQTPNSSFDRKTTNLSITSHLGKNDFIVIEGNAQYNYEKGHNRPNVGYAELNPSWATYLLGNTVDIRSLAPGYNDVGKEIEWNPVPAAPNPWFVVNKTGNEDRRNRFIGSASVQVNILKNLFVKGIVSKDFLYSDRYNFVPIGSAFTPKGYFNSYTDQFDIDNSRATINYNTDFAKDFNVSAFVGVNRERQNGISSSITGRDFILPDFISYTNLSTLNPPQRTERHFGTNSFFGSVDLDYKRIVYISFTGRQDWFSTLNPGSNSIFYPSVGGSFILSDALKLPAVISYLKLRGSWAQVGNATVDPYVINQTFYLTPGGFNGLPVLNGTNRLPNPGLRPLTVTTSEGGFEIQFLNGRLGLDATYYDRKTTNNILQPDISNATGYLAGNQNVGTLRNRGIELLLTATPYVTRDFQWNISYNMAWNKNEILGLAPGLTTLSIGAGISSGVNVISQVGLPYATLQGLVFLKDNKGQQVYNATTSYEASVRQNIGVANPPTLMGLTNEFRYKRFSLNILLDAKFGAMGYSNLWQYASRFGLTKETLPGREGGLQLSGVDQDGNAFSKLWAVELLDTYYNNRGNNYSGSVNVFKTDFVKLRSLILGYTLPVDKLKLIRLQSASISIVSRNLLILYRDKRVRDAGLDPEFGQTVSNTTGTAGTGEPRTRDIGVNLSIKF
ncbi:MAG: SusC/RagA family TonB-linked outer membrane protein [Chitinophagaceae bacterium]|nr:SusC/RagA family TonB-linked outer membrane protein [Chitinophagaceae bacterium]